VKKTLLIGCGNAGLLHEFDSLRKKPASLIGGLLKLQDYYKLIGAVDIDIEKAEKVRQLLPDVKAFTNYKIALNKLKPDVVIIATWTATHKAVFNYCLKSGVRGIILEKPVGITLKEAKLMLRNWKKNKIPVVINHERRWEPRYLLLKEVLESKELGSLRGVYGKVLLGAIPKKYEKLVYETEGGGTLLHDGTHLIDLINFYFKRVKVIDAHVKMGQIIDKTSNALLIANNNIPIHVEVGGQRGYFEFSLSFEFAFGVVKVGNGIFEWYETERSRLYSGYRDLKQKHFPYERLNEFITTGFTGPFYELKQAFENDTIETNSSIEDGVKAMSIIDKILKFQ
jgi:predicted dehydrogenase